MTLIEKLKDPKTDTFAFARLVFLWLTDAGGAAATFAADVVAFYSLTAANIATLDEIKVVYDGKTSNLQKLFYATTVKTVIELISSRSHVYGGRTFPMSNAFIHDVLEL